MALSKKSHVYNIANRGIDNMSLGFLYLTLNCFAKGEQSDSNGKKGGDQQ